MTYPVLRTHHHSIRLLIFLFLILSACKKTESKNDDVNIVKSPLKSLDLTINDVKADKINLIIIGKGYADTNVFLKTVRRDLALDGKELIDANTFDKVLFGLFAIEPFKGNLSKFNKIGRAHV